MLPGLKLGKYSCELEHRAMGHLKTLGWKSMRLKNESAEWWGETTRGYIEH
jgi:hypothetical protein